MEDTTLALVLSIGTIVVLWIGIVVALGLIASRRGIQFFVYQKFQERENGPESHKIGDLQHRAFVEEIAYETLAIGRRLLLTNGVIVTAALLWVATEIVPKLSASFLEILKP